MMDRREHSTEGFWVTEEDLRRLRVSAMTIRLLGIALLLALLLLTAGVATTLLVLPLEKAFPAIPFYLLAMHAWVQGVKGWRDRRQSQRVLRDILTRPSPRG